MKQQWNHLSLELGYFLVTNLASTYYALPIMYISKLKAIW